MKTILHVFDVEAPRERVFEALTTSDALSRWWTTTVAVDGDRVQFTFGGEFNPTMLVTERDDAAVVGWTCIGGVEQWADNTFRFQLAERSGGTRLRFRQDYAAELSDDDYGVYNYNWGYYLESLRLYCETGTGKPFGLDGTALVSIASATAAPGKAGELRRELLDRVAPTRDQRGCVEFTLLELVDGDETVVAFERWASRSDWERHLQGEHVTSLLGVFEQLLAAPADIRIYSPVAG